VTDLRTLTGAALDAALDDIARLRIAVFRDWPYLYAGTLQHERDYLATYRNSPAAIVVGAFDGTALVGAATGTQMEDHAAEFAAPFAAQNLPLDEIFYCAESVLLASHRGQGLGHGFFDLREAHARALGRKYMAFCSVMRPDNHPLRPADARSNHAFWRGRGYAPVAGVVAEFDWLDVGQTAPSRKSLQFWMRSL
jgi:GNAT superfamily N-acetyltransferase